MMAASKPTGLVSKDLVCVNLFLWKKLSSLVISPNWDHLKEKTNDHVFDIC